MTVFQLIYRDNVIIKTYNLPNTPSSDLGIRPIIIGDEELECAYIRANTILEAVQKLTEMTGIEYRLNLIL